MAAMTFDGARCIIEYISFSEQCSRVQFIYIYIRNENAQKSAHKEGESCDALQRDVLRMRATDKFIFNSVVDFGKNIQIKYKNKIKLKSI